MTPRNVVGKASTIACLSIRVACLDSFTLQCCLTRFADMFACSLRRLPFPEPDCPGLPIDFGRLPLLRMRSALRYFPISSKPRRSGPSIATTSNSLLPATDSIASWRSGDMARKRRMSHSISPSFHDRRQTALVLFCVDQPTSIPSTLPVVGNPAHGLRVLPEHRRKLFISAPVRRALTISGKTSGCSTQREYSCKVRPRKSWMVLSLSHSCQRAT